MTDWNQDAAEARVRENFERQGLMKTLGATLRYVGRGEVTIAMTPSPATTQQHGYVHAGAVTSLLDVACGYAALTLMPQGFEVLSVEFKTNFLAPARGTSILAEGTVIRSGRTLSVCRADAFAQQGPSRVIVATMIGTMMQISAERAAPLERGRMA